MRSYRIIKRSTKKGQQLCEFAHRYLGRSLRDVYGSWSQEKEDEYNKCLAEYLETPDHQAFGICGANSWMFSVSWLGRYEGMNALYYITKCNNYVILLDE